MKRVIAAAVALVLLVAASVAGLNYAGADRHMRGVLDEDARNKGVEASAHWGNYVQPSVLVLNLKSVSETNSPADVFRVVLQFAKAMKDKEFDRVELAFQGDTRFVLEGKFFKQLGVEFGSQNVMYTIRTFPENLKRPDGSPAFGTWTGGVLGVLGKQMEDFNEFCRQWFLNGAAPQSKSK